MTLAAKQFPDFYRAVNGYPPFPWQSRLVEEVDRHNGRWPAVLDLPTSAGKTSALDAAVFLLATQAGKPIHERTAAVRTFFVVDRRIVVDEAAEKAHKLAKLLNAAGDNPAGAARAQAVAREQRRVKLEEPDPLSPGDVAIIQAVASRLRQYGGAKALHVSVLRGGMYRDGSWAESPTQPTVCLSTVDQVGSRLLFRGYGVSPYQRAVHAGLVGNDALILVDEAHLSRPFIETLKAVEFYRGSRWAEREVRAPFQVVVMSATAGDAVTPVVPPSAALPEPIKLDQADRETPVLKLRLEASKAARLEDVKGGTDNEEKNRQQFAEAVAGFARELAAPPPSPNKTNSASSTPPVMVVGVVANRVDTARRVYRDLLAGRDAATPQFDVILLTGRTRPYDRDRLLAEWFRYMAADSDRPDPPNGQLFVVATQTVEVGANLSFDALVTEAAPLDAIRQRFGRLDRLGLRGTSHAVIVARKDLLKLDDPVYGKAIKASWDWLAKNLTGTGKNKRIDFGIDALAKRLPTDVTPLSAPPAHAPVMMPAHLDDWVQTSVPPEPDPPPALFLHGPQSRPADVSVVWRADVPETLLRHEMGKKDATTARRVVALVPPTSMEALSVPIWAVRKWLSGQSVDVTDLEGEREPDEDRREEQRQMRPALRWRGPAADDGTAVAVKPGDIRPGDTLVVPRSYGGCDKYGWNPDSQEPVADVADDCSWRAKRRPVLRVHRPSRVHCEALAVWGILPRTDGRTLADALATAAEPDEETGETPTRAVLASLRAWRALPGWLTRAAGDRKAREIPYPTRDGVVVLMPVQRPGRDESVARGEEAPADDEGNSFIGSDGFVSLADHCRGVQVEVLNVGERLGLAHDLREVVSRAALLHDAGKGDPRFQDWLYVGEAEAARNGFRLIAKSRTEGQNSASIEASRVRAGWPKGGRHEAGSVLLVRDNPGAAAGLDDPELLLHLIGTHHGRGRPLWPFAEDEEEVEAPGAVAVELGEYTLSAQLPLRPETPLTPLSDEWVERFWRLVRRYGYWGLAYLETLLVLADHQQSEAERTAQSENP